MQRSINDTLYPLERIFAYIYVQIYTKSNQHRRAIEEKVTGYLRHGYSYRNLVEREFKKPKAAEYREGLGLMLERAILISFIEIKSL